MTQEPAIVIDETALQTLLAARVNERRNIIAAVDEVRQRLHEPPDGVHHDKVGRPIRVLVARGYLVTHWEDGPVNELRIVDIQKVRGK